MTNKFLGLVFAGVLSLSLTQTALACAFHGYTPNPTLVDVLLTTEQVAVARLDPAQPSRYKLVEVLMGPDVSDIPLPVAKSVRKLLAARPSRSVLLARDGAYGPWLALTILDSRLHDVVKQVTQRQSALINGGDEKRLAFFAKLLNDPSPAVGRLALQELDRAPYSALRGVKLPNIQNLKRQLETGDEELMPVRILLAGLSRNQGYSHFLSDELDMAIEGNIPYMGAYATALIELGGAKAAQEIIDHHLKPQVLPFETRVKLLQALSVQHKASPRSTRRAIARGVAELLRSSPDLKEPAAQYFGFRIR